MSVLINMDMPKTCEECALNYDSFACIKTGSRFFRDRETEFDPFKGRLEDCPLVPVPKHGRLIEKHDVFKLISAFPEVDKLLPVEFMKALYNLPTIIEAEEGE